MFRHVFLFIMELSSFSGARYAVYILLLFIKWKHFKQQTERIKLKTMAIQPIATVLWTHLIAVAIAIRFRISKDFDVKRCYFFPFWIGFYWCFFLFHLRFLDQVHTKNTEIHWIFTVLLLKSNEMKWNTLTLTLTLFFRKSSFCLSFVGWRYMYVFFCDSVSAAQISSNGFYFIISFLSVHFGIFCGDEFVVCHTLLDA